MYRYSYNFLLLTEQDFQYQDEWLNGVSIDISIKLFDNKGNEVLFDDDETEKKVTIPHSEPFFTNNQGYLNELINVYFNPNNDHFIDIYLNEDVLERSGYVIDYMISGYNKELSNDSDINDEFMTEVPIPMDEYEDIVSINTEKFDNDINAPAHVSSLFIADEESF